MPLCLQDGMDVASFLKQQNLDAAQLELHKGSAGSGWTDQSKSLTDRKDEFMLKR